MTGRLPHAATTVSVTVTVTVTDQFPTLRERR
jgi:hypothetical protein